MSAEKREDSIKGESEFYESSVTNKANRDAVEDGTTAATYAETVAANLSEEHKEYLIQRHGTLDLDPVPGMGPANPYNWPMPKKVINLILVSFHAFQATFTAAGIIPAYADISNDFGVSMQRASYLTSLQIALLGGTPLFWKPLSNRYGRRPIFILSLISSLVCNVGCAKSNSYAALAACRALVAFFIAPAGALGTAVATETFFKKNRAVCIGVWTTMLTIGIPFGPLIFGFVTNRAGYRWIYWILAITNGVDLILYSFLGPETLYKGSGEESKKSQWKNEYLSVRRIDTTPFTWYEFVQPLIMVVRPTVTIPAVAHSMNFIFSNILFSVEMPQLVQVKFGLNAEQLGLQFLGLIIGTLLGEQIGGKLSDIWMSWRTRRIGYRPRPEFRLWLSYPAFVLSIVGLIVFLVCLQEAKPNHWTIAPIIGTAIAAFGNQTSTTVLITYAVDCYPKEAASIGVFITFVRLIWGFTGPFWFTPMFDDVGIAASSGVGCALLVGVGIIPTVLLHWKGNSWHRSKKENARS